jgi:aerobic C4-dicarboxylate transport protein
MSEIPTTKKRAPTLYLQVVVAVVCGIALGLLKPEWATACRGLGELFVRFVKLLVTPVVFTTVALGVAGTGENASSSGKSPSAGKTFFRAIVYFEALTTLALLVGLAVVHLVKPGAGIHADPKTLDSAALAEVTKNAGPAKHGFDHILALVPKSIVAPFAEGDMLQVLTLAVLTGVALRALGAPLRAECTRGIEAIGKLAFAAVGKVMILAPLGAFGAMAFTVGKYGVGSLAGMLKLMVAFYITGALFVVVVLGAVCRIIRIPLFGLLAYLREELLLVLGTSSSESALPTLMDKLEDAGIAPRVVRLVVPTGYSFNLDGTSIYLTMAAVFVAQALDIPLTFRDEVLLLGLLLLTSKGAAAVTGGGFVTLAATLSSVGTIPVAGLALLLGVDRFMSEARALVNLVGNAVAAYVVAAWEGELDREAMARAFAKKRL